jgi:hypothetical protein
VNADTDFFLAGGAFQPGCVGWPYLPQFGRAGSHPLARHRDQLLLLGGRDPGYGLRWALHDALSVFTGDSLTVLVGGLALEDLGIPGSIASIQSLEVCSTGVY